MPRNTISSTPAPPSSPIRGFSFPETEEDKKRGALNLVRARALVSFGRAEEKIQKSIKDVAKPWFSTAHMNEISMSSIELWEQVQKWRSKPDLVGSEEFEKVERMAEKLWEVGGCRKKFEKKGTGRASEWR
ncbi:hypothetical protein LTR09_001785 [Extremus antarcticus]|uniref:Uncharacterized protein n=1 Tax=Extremus antarcticus TaxID=702011 RepID=A0AAJ0LWE7_9PEZI|nr:hypothetical protein LTR09_001785 [Extremus antarcticus]